MAQTKKQTNFRKKTITKNRQTKKGGNNQQKNKRNQQRVGGGIWDLLGYTEDTPEIKALKEQKAVCTKNEKTSLDQTNLAIKTAETAIQKAKQQIEQIKNERKECNSKIDLQIQKQQNLDKARKLTEDANNMNPMMNAPVAEVPVAPPAVPQVNQNPAVVDPTFDSQPNYPIQQEQAKGGKKNKRREKK
jgi:chromosome segregation ATPase